MIYKIEFDDNSKIIEVEQGGSSDFNIHLEENYPDSSSYFNMPIDIKSLNELIKALKLIRKDFKEKM